MFDLGSYWPASDNFAGGILKALFDHCLYTKMVGSAHFVKSTPPRAFSISF